MEDTIIDTYLIITDITGKQYPYFVPDEGIVIGGILATKDNLKLGEIEKMIQNSTTFIVGERILRTEHVIEVGFKQHPRGAF